MKIGIHQGGYIPWIGFFEQIDRCDRFVLHEHNPYQRHSWRNRNRIRTAHDWMWVSVPVLTRGSRGMQLCAARIDNSRNWREKHWKQISQTYARCAFLDDYRDTLHSFYFDRSWELLVDLNFALIEWIAAELEIKTPIIRSSCLVSRATKTDGIIEICRELGADEYLSSSVARDYINEERLEDAGIKLEYQDYIHPVYQQPWPGDFVPYMSVLDLLFNCGPDSRRLMLEGRTGSKTKDNLT